MKLNDLLTHTSEWLKGTGPNSNIVISSRVRLARNLDKTPFPHWANKKVSSTSLEKLHNAIGFGLKELGNITKGLDYSFQEVIYSPPLYSRNKDSIFIHFLVSKMFKCRGFIPGPVSIQQQINFIKYGNTRLIHKIHVGNYLFNHLALLGSIWSG